MPKLGVPKLNDMYNRIERLCKERGINMTQMCQEADIPRGNLTDLKMGRTAALSTKNLGKISSYFTVSMDYLLGNVSEPFLTKNEKGILDIDIGLLVGTKKAPTLEGKRESKKEELMAAFWGGEKDLSPEDLEAMWADVENFAAFVAEKKRREKQK